MTSNEVDALVAVEYVQPYCPECRYPLERPPLTKFYLRLWCVVRCEWCKRDVKARFMREQE